MHIQYCISALGGAVSFHLKPIVSVQKKIARCVYCVSALTPTNFWYVKTGILKLNEVFNLQVPKLMLNTFRGFEIEHSGFTPVSMVHTHKNRHSKKKNYTWMGLGLNSFRHSGPNLWSSVRENLKKWV